MRVDVLVGGSSILNDIHNKYTVDFKSVAGFRFRIIPCVGMNYYIANWCCEFGWGVLQHQMDKEHYYTNNRQNKLFWIWKYRQWFDYSYCAFY
jgi:hypothetical protein